MHREFPAGALGDARFGRAPPLPEDHGRVDGARGHRASPAAAAGPRSTSPRTRTGRRVAIPASPARYATCMDLGGVAAGLLVTSSRRPTDQDRGQSRASGQPRRGRHLRPGAAFSISTIPTAAATCCTTASRPTWGEFAGWATDHFDKLRANARRGPRDPRGSQLLADRRRDEAPRAWSASRTRRGTSTSRSTTTTVVAGAEMAFGSRVPHARRSRGGTRDRVARRRLLLGPHANAVPTIRGFAAVAPCRRPPATMNRLYVFESDLLAHRRERRPARRPSARATSP